jgi:hypothetical protein
MSDKPLIQDFSWGIDNLDKKREREISNKEIADLKASAKPEETLKMQEESQMHLWRLNPNEKKDIDRIKAMEVLEIQLDNWEITEKEYDIALDNLTEKKVSIEENEQISESKEKENKQILEKFKDNPSFPVLERFINIEVSEWKKLNLLTESDLLQLSQHLWSSEDMIWDLRNWIKNIDFENESTQQILSNYLDKAESINKPLELDDDGQYTLPDDFKWHMVLSENIDNDIVQLLIKNYIKLPDWNNWESNIENDLYTACEVTLNKIIEWKNFRKTDTYYDAVDDIRNWDLDLRVEALQYINSLVNTSEWMKWWKAKSNFNKIKSEHSLTKKLYIEFKINQIEEQISTSNNNKEQQKLKIELANLIESVDNEDHFEWEVISWGKIDVHWEWNDNIYENT